MSHDTSDGVVDASTLEPEFAALVAIDWADQEHVWKLRDSASGCYEQGVQSAQAAALQQWAISLEHRYGGRPIAVALEQSRGGLVYQLRQYRHLVLYPVHPNMAAQFRQALLPSGRKSDASDAGVLLELLEHHRSYLRRLPPESPQTRELHLLSEQRRLLVEQKTAFSNRLTAALKSYFPQVLDWFPDIDSPLACDFLEQWPSLQQLQRTKPNTLHRFFTAHNCRGAERIQQRITAIYEATPALTDESIISAGSLTVTAVVGVLKSLAVGIRAFQKRIEQVVDTHPEKDLFGTFPGAGPALLPRLLAAFGTHRDRFERVEQMQSYSGVAPITERSGKTVFVHMRKGCPKFLRQTFVEFAQHSMKKSQWARGFYNLKRSHNMGHQAALRALAFKWQRILFRCWKERKPYDEQIYLNALQKHHSVVATCIGWKTVAGFQKPTLKKA